MLLVKSELLSQEKNFVTIKVTVDKADFAKGLNSTYNELAKKVNIPGFRKGKAPRSVLDMRFGRETLKSQALEDMLPQLLEEICNEYELEPIASPSVDDVSLKDGEDVFFTVKYEVEPEVTLPELESITVDLPVFDVTDAMVDESLASMKKRFCSYSPVARASKSGDKVRAAYSMKVEGDDGNAIVSHEPQMETFELDGMSMRPEILAALTGVEAGAHAVADVTIAQDYQDKRVAGRVAHYDFDVVEVQEPIEPEMNEEFFKKASPADVHSEEELRAEIRRSMDERMKADARRMAENEALSKIAEAATVDLPDSMVQRQKDHLRKTFEDNVKERTKMTLEEFYKSEGRDMKEFEDGLDQDARRDVRGYLVVDACAKLLGVSVQKEDLDSEIAQMAESYGISAESVRDMLNKRPQDFDSMYSSARYRKTLAAVMEKVKVNEVKKGLDALMPPAEEAPAAPDENSPAPEQN